MVNQKKSRYRKFKIKTVEGANDVASIQEVLRRRFKRAAEANGEVLSSEFSVMSENSPPVNADANNAVQRAIDEAVVQEYDQETIQNSKLKTQNSHDETWAELPDLILIDGGIGQLNGALEVLRELRFEHLPTVGVVKGINRDRFDLLQPGASQLIVLERDSPALRLVRQIDEETDRFAKDFHRTLRSKAAFKSTLDDIAGIGPRRKKELLKRFGSLDGIRKASIEELAAVPGMTKRAAEELKSML